ncbi:hypothetical protein BJP08_01240 [Corynebacterium sp. NML140438]|uniref:porin PorA family protein n=1 Tax=Corynebacterium sp. NML140438 TaxID=1906334 RepID=UPI0009151158|nr:porin PorA family protein [Corynebacterium sp. NML140438]OIR44784.1 hypothetical protein BJP08_01240 [Corynebacterium sp. NML140438]
MRHHNAERRDTAQARQFREYVNVSDVDIVSKRRLGICAAIIAVCVALNFLSPLIINHQRVLAPTESTLLFDGPSALTRTLLITEGPSEEHPKKKALTMSATVRNEGTVIAEDSFEVNPASAYPTSGRQGLGYVLPYNPERRSYPFYDPLADLVVPLDYLGAGWVADLETYKYTATIDVPEYHAERTIDVERRTGRLLDESWTITRGPLKGLYTLSEENKATAASAALHDVHILKSLQVMAFVTRLVSALALFYAFVLLVRRRRG